MRLSLCFESDNLMRLICVGVCWVSVAKIILFSCLALDRSSGYYIISPEFLPRAFLIPSLLHSWLCLPSLAVLPPSQLWITAFEGSTSHHIIKHNTQHTSQIHGLALCICTNFVGKENMESTHCISQLYLDGSQTCGPNSNPQVSLVLRVIVLAVKLSSGFEFPFFSPELTHDQETGKQGWIPIWYHVSSCHAHLVTFVI